LAGADNSGCKANVRFRCKPAKVLIPFHAQPEARNQMWVELQGLEKTFGIRSVLNWTVTTARRERL